MCIPQGSPLITWTGWITLTAFPGGQAPFFFLEFEGFNPILGLFWLIFVDPIFMTVAYWILMLLMLSLVALAAGASAKVERKKSKWR